MRRKRKKKKNNFKRLVGIFTVFFICTLLAMYKNDIRAEGSTVVGNNNEIKILEIEPGNQFLLGDSTKNELTLIGECQPQLKSGKNVKITHVTMAQFISMSDEINGEYDVVVIGRQNENLKGVYSKGTPYRDYTNPLSEPLKKLPLSTWEQISNWKNNYNTLGGIKFAEYYSENDITKKRADEIIKMINSNQLVYIDNRIFDTTSNAIAKTKLYNTFRDMQTSNNFIKQSSANITIENIVDKYLTGILEEAKRPQVIQVTKPVDDSNPNAVELANRQMNYTITLNSITSKILKAKLFLDLNSDGLFKEKELVANLDINEIVGKNDYSLNYTLDNRFVGYLDWKIELARSNGIKTNILGNSEYKPLISKKSIKVLQIMPDSSSINLSTDSNVITLTQDLAVSQDYNLSIESKTVDQVNMLGQNFKLNGYYDMVIMGFADRYGNKQLNLEIINEIEAFAKTGQSVIFTHDTMTPALTNELPSITGPKLLTQRFRDYVGQARYQDPYRLNNGIIDEVDVYKNYMQDTNGNVVITDKIIPHDSFNYNPIDDISGTSNKAYSLGTTFQGHINSDSTIWDSVSKVKRVNNNQINNYPFLLSDEINVAPTHTQWYQLNLEDQDVVPLYNMSSANFDSGDARNYYYTYSKGNITHSGIGHTLSIVDNELRLFINTMVKAERGSNHKPDVISSIGSEYKVTDTNSINEVPAGMSYSFYVDTSDLDDDVNYVDIKVNGQSLTEKNVMLNKLEINGLFKVNTKNTNREPLKVTIPAEQLPKGGSDVTVVIKSADFQGAKSEIKTYIIKPIEMPKFNIKAELDKTNLKKIDASGNLLDTAVSGTTISVKLGDIVNVPYKVSPESLVYGDVRETKYREMAVLLDDSITPNIWASFKNPLSDVLTELLGTSEVRANFITFGNTGAKSIFYGSTYKDITNKNYGSEMGKAPGIKKINSALNMSIEFFNSFNFPINETSKNIIIFSAGNVEPITDQIRSLIKDNYNVITVQISENGESIVLKTVHVALGGLNSDYYLCNPNNTGSANHSSAEWIMNEISKTVGSMIYPTYLLSNVKMNFNLGNNIDLVGNGLIRVELGTKKYTKALPQIKYKIEYENGLPKQTVDGKLIYVGSFLDASLIDSKNYLVNFKITTSQNAHGLCEFSIPNEITYNYVELGALGSTEISETPKLRLEEFTVDHGVYKGMNGSLASIDTERDKLKFATGALVPFASNIQGLYGGPISLAIDNDCKFEGVIKIYNIDTGVLIDIITPEAGVNKKVISIDYQIYHNIFIIYNVKLNGTSKIYYENDIQINGMNYPAYVSPSSSLLPDLF